MLVVAVVALLVTQSGGEGEGEGEADACDPACVDATHLAFCDAGAPTTLDCAVVAPDARCGALSDDWGPDCLLPAGAACDPDYGFGDSRCDDGLACIENACAVGEPSPATPAAPTPGTTIATTTTSSTSTLGCLGCASSDPSLPGLLVALAALARRRWRAP